MGQPTCIFFLHQLIVRAFAAKSFRQFPLDNSNEIGIHEGHAFAGQFFIAANSAQMRAEANLSEGAPTVLLREIAVIAHSDIQEKFGRFVEQRCE